VPVHFFGDITDPLGRVADVINLTTSLVTLRLIVRCRFLPADVENLAWVELDDAIRRLSDRQAPQLVEVQCYVEDPEGASIAPLLPTSMYLPNFSIIPDL
jgi:hypothetical protein